jgi:hypothetical protein
LLGLNANKFLPFPGGRATQTCKFVLSAIPKDSGDCDSQPGRADLSDLDRDDYNYAQQASGGESERERMTQRERERERERER